MTDFGSYSLTESEQSRISAAENLKASGASKITALIGMLADASWVVRRSVVEALASLGQPAVEPLCNLLRNQRDHEARIAAAVDALVATRAEVDGAVYRLAGDSDPAIVADAVQILGRRRSISAVSILIQLTRHENDNVSVGAIEALGRIGGRAAVEALIEAVGSGNFFRTFPAIDVLGRSGDPRAVEPLAKLLKNPNYLTEAARALGRSGDRAAVKPLLELLKSGTDSVVRIAALSLWDLRDRFVDKTGGEASLIDELFQTLVDSEAVRRLTRVMSNAEDLEAIAICRLLGAVGNAEAAEMLGLKLDASPPVAECAAASLKKIGKEAGIQLIQSLRDGASARRKILLPVVMRSGAAIEVALCLDDPDPEVRALACDTLGRLGNSVVVTRIFRMLADPNLRVVHSATAAIQALGTREARQLAIQAAKSKNPVERRSALRILAYFGDTEALQPMLAGLRDDDSRVREAALQGLPYLEDPSATEALFDATKSVDARTRALSMRCLGLLPKANERAYSVLLKGLHDQDAWVRYYACQSLGRLGFAPAADDIAALLRDDAGQVRVSAVESLSHLESPAAYTALRIAATSEDTDVKRASLVGLGIAHRNDDLPIILAAVNSTDVPTRLMALSALERYPSSAVLRALSAAGSDSDEQVRWAAIGFLAARQEQEATEVLVELLGSEPTRERAKSALLLPSQGRLAGLLVALESADDELAPVLISILARTPRFESRMGLLSAMKLNNVAARKAAASGLAARRDPEMIAALQEAADKDPNLEVRQICSLLLKE